MKSSEDGGGRRRSETDSVRHATPGIPRHPRGPVRGRGGHRHLELRRFRREHGRDVARQRQPGSRQAQPAAASAEFRVPARRAHVQRTHPARLGHGDRARSGRELDRRRRPHGMELQAPRGCALPRRAAGDRGRRGRFADRGAGQEHRLAGPAQPRPHRKRRRRIERYGVDQNLGGLRRPAQRARLLHREDRSGRRREERSRPPQPGSHRLGSFQASGLRVGPPHRGGEEPGLLHRRTAVSRPGGGHGVSGLRGGDGGPRRRRDRHRARSSAGGLQAGRRDRRRHRAADPVRTLHRRGDGQRPQALQRSQGARGALPHPGPPGHDRSGGRRIRDSPQRHADQLRREGRPSAWRRSRSAPAHRHAERAAEAAPRPRRAAPTALRLGRRHRTGDRRRCHPSILQGASSTCW